MNIRNIFSFPHHLRRNFSLSYAVYYHLSSFKFIARIGLPSLLQYLKDKKTAYINQYITDNFRERIDTYKNRGERTTQTAEFKLWVFWAQGFDNAPDIVKICHKNLCNIYGDSVMSLTMNNFTEYAEIPSHVIDKLNSKQITLTHFSDLIRLDLLTRRGGIWIDATCWCEKGLEEVYNKGGLVTLKSDLTKNPVYISNNRWTIWAIGCSDRENTLVSLARDLLYDYWRINNVMLDYFLIDYFINYIYDNFSEAKAMIDEVAIDGKKRSELMKAINSAYDMERYNNLLTGSMISKLSYKTRLTEHTKDGRMTIYGKMKSIYSDQ